MRGTHPRNWIQVDTGYENDGLIDADISHEEPCKPYGTFGVIDGGCYSNKWYVIWRPSRRNTRHWNIRVMTHPCQQRVGVYDCCDDAINSIPYWMVNFVVPPEKKKRSHRPRDAQKSKVYSWESWMAMTISPEEDDIVVLPTGGTARKIFASLERRRDKKYIQEFLATICAELSEEMPELKFRTGGRRSYGSSRRIRLIRSNLTQRMLLHELAHGLHDRWTDWRNLQSHGKEFVGIYMYLLVRFGGVDYLRLLDTANKRKVKFNIPTEFSEWNLKEAA